jgi:hypothetical protein
MDSLLNAMGSWQSQAEAAEQALALAHRNADYAAVAKHQRALAKAEAELTNLEREKTILDSRQQQTRQQPKTQQPPRQMTVEDVLANVSG